MHQFDIAVVIVTYKSADLTVESLRSLQSERSSGLKIRAIVVDNASGDLPAIGRQVAANGWWSWVTLLPAPRNGGFAYGNNVGIQCAFASGIPSYVYLLNPDAQVRPGAIASLIEFLESNPDVGIAGGSFENLDGSDWPMAFRFPGLVSELLDGLQLGLASKLLNRWNVAMVMNGTNQPVDWVSGASMMIRPSVFKSIGGLDENYFLYFEETDFCRRSKQAGFSTWYVPKSRVMHIAGQSTNVTNYSDQPKRLPAYWFASRRRYFAMTYGTFRAMLIDIVALFAQSVGSVKRAALSRDHTTTPYYIRDLLEHSILHRRNRDFPPPRSPDFGDGAH